MQSLNLNVSGLPISATLAINERCRALRQEGRKIYNFGLGQSPFPVPEQVQEALRANTHQKDYLAVEGLPELRQAIADYHQRTSQCDYNADQVLVGPGSKELMFLVQLVYYGDLVIPTPSWVSYAPQARIVGRRVEWLPTKAENNWLLAPETLEKHCRQDPDRPRLVFINYPSNPTGATFSEAQLKEIAEVARTYDLIILSDEIYSELHHEAAHVSIACHYPEGTIISNGLSKWCGSGGWRLGYFIFPEALEKLQISMAVAASETFTSTSAPIQYAAVEAYRQTPELTEYLNTSRRILKTIGRYAIQVLRNLDLTVPEPAGGFYLFPDFSAYREELAARSVTTSKELSEYLLEQTGVAVLPGSAFGCPESELSVRMAYIGFDGKAALQNFDSLSSRNGRKDFLKEICPDVVEGLQRLAEEVRYW